MLEDSGSSEKAEQSLSAASVSVDEEPEVSPGTVQNGYPKHFVSDILPRLILIGGAAACICGVCLLYMMNRSYPDDRINDSIYVQLTEITNVPVTEIPADPADTTSSADEAVRVTGITTVRQQTIAAFSGTDKTAFAQNDRPDRTTVTHSGTTVTTVTENGASRNTEQSTILRTEQNTSRTTTTTPASVQTSPPAFPYVQPPYDYFKACAQHGTVIREDYTGVYGDNTLFVYLPYGYNENMKYNILYLSYLGGEYAEEGSAYWFDDADANLDVMLDNMIANHEIEPMIVVAPSHDKCLEAEDDMWTEMRESIIPTVESKYSTYADSVSAADLKASRYHRAFGGYLTGASMTWTILKNDLDMIAYYLPMSGGYQGELSDLTSAIDRFGYPNDAFYIFAAGGKGNDLANSEMDALMQMLCTDPHFTPSDSFNNGNLIYLVCEDGVPWSRFMRNYICNALPLFFRHGT